MTRGHSAGRVSGLSGLCISNFQFDSEPVACLTRGLKAMHVPMYTHVHSMKQQRELEYANCKGFVVSCRLRSPLYLVIYVVGSD